MKAELRVALRSARRLFWRKLLRLSDVHPTVLFGGYGDISRDFHADEYVYVGPGCRINPGVRVGSYSMLGPDVQIVGNDHVFDIPGVPIIFCGRPAFRPTRIGKDVWIGAGATILCGKTIGDGAVVASGAVVTHDVEPFTVVGGVPARLMRRRFPILRDELIHRKMLETPVVSGQYCAPVAARQEA
ncbi:MULTISPECIES: acyltransferase [Paraburkholderia]|uniref:2,3,4,5-tetrahydropyridine-2,6-dicarboxylate N-acetyltransferase n=1 Tax=Paraburkholderia nemoris TaxID=2793076 RepID=A0ABM8SQ49_9BURK|nr:MULTISPECIES: acyltransferase [Paraburkholderia]CAE6824446.1 2,3,4,5-tetrahydropyridine-2,6-dicarboxylate N-acetyltransferase [Paraburkholderia nemoris]CAE6841647.1 2,3,4,5-tetrahydropyridine-2,6-dicarboxylate N-acetyltransferase [Paraburkholderia nemoris]CAE6854705.1 2,3,4,5-tetrahydropyridine-2,6-dicarboxylate N-acetyltransferase [Paraburkholderia nemoris]CAE6892005.1 2,3,4,5-tetrahydropyridine-2,6-dicarboxylate N-acetyltransferase [Paraburkholderia domus]CAE6971437.1 2,3,4,5-tetrahydropy